MPDFKFTKDSTIGDGTKIGQFCEIYGAEIGENCNIQAFCYIPKGIKIRNNVFIGPGVTFLNDKYPPSNGAWEEYPATIVGDNVSIGARSIIMPHIKIGSGAVIGAGSLVTKDVPPNMLAYGHPAKIHHKIEKYEGDE